MGQKLSHSDTELVPDTVVELSLGDQHYLLLWPEVSFQLCFVASSHAQT